MLPRNEYRGEKCASISSRIQLRVGPFLLIEYPSMEKVDNAAALRDGGIAREVL